MKLPKRKNQWEYAVCVAWVRQDFSTLLRYVDELQNEYNGFVTSFELNKLRELVCWAYNNVIKYFEVEELSEERESLLHALNVYNWEQFVSLAKILAESYANLEE